MAFVGLILALAASHGIGPGVAEPIFLAQAMLGGFPNAGGLVRLCAGLTLVFTAYQAANFRA